MTNKEKAKQLRDLADVYDVAEENLPTWFGVIYVNSKDEALKLVRAIGGGFTKDMGDPNFEYAQVKLKSVRIPGVEISLPRDKVCRKTVRWDCEPLLSDEDHADIDGEIAE